MTDMKYGVTPREVAAELTGLELLRGALEGRYPGAPIAQGMNFRFAEVEEGRVVFTGEPGPEHLNPLGSIHGGWVLTLIDSACGCAGHSVLPAGVGYTTLELKVNYIRTVPVDGRRLRAEGTVIHVGRRVATAEGRVLDERGKLVAHGSTTCMVL